MALKILTVDDSKTIRMIVKKAFKPYDCELIEGENGVEGLSLAAKEKPDLIILDITMPVMNGIEMLGKLKAENSLKNIPVIMLTAESGKQNVMQIVKMGVKDYMVKPFKGDQLIDRASKIVKLESKDDNKSEDSTSLKYIIEDGDIHILNMPENVDRLKTVNIEGAVKNKIKDMNASGHEKLIIDLNKAGKVSVVLIELIAKVFLTCKKSKIKARILCQSSMEQELKGFQETGNIPIDLSLEEAKEAF